jgi:hypothetical protein
MDTDLALEGGILEDGIPSGSHFPSSTCLGSHQGWKLGALENSSLRGYLPGGWEGGAAVVRVRMALGTVGSYISMFHPYQSTVSPRLFI